MERFVIRLLILLERTFSTICSMSRIPSRSSQAMSIREMLALSSADRRRNSSEKADSAACSPPGGESLDTVQGPIPDTPGLPSLAPSPLPKTSASPPLPDSSSRFLPPVLIFAHRRQYKHIAVGHLYASCRLKSTFCPSLEYIPWIAAIYTKLFLAHIELLSGVPPRLILSGKYALFLPAHCCALPASSRSATILAIKISRTSSVRLSIFNIELAKTQKTKYPP